MTHESSSHPFLNSLPTSSRHESDEAFDRFVNSARFFAGEAGRGLGAFARWLESDAFQVAPFTTLGMAFGLGVVTGWLVKRR